LPRRSPFSPLLLAQTTGTAPAEAKFSTVAKDEMFSSKLKGLNVYNQKDEKVGEIADLAIGKGEQVQAMIRRWAGSSALASTMSPCRLRPSASATIRTRTHGPRR
jgi:hypothetical protein